MLHALALVEIKNGSAEKLLKSFFKVAFVNSYFATKFLDGNRLPDVLQKNFTGANDFLPVVLICEELALETFNILVAQHTFEAVQQQHLRLSVDVNILETVVVIIIKKRFYDQRTSSADRQYL